MTKRWEVQGCMALNPFAPNHGFIIISQGTQCHFSLDLLYLILLYFSILSSEHILPYW